MRSFCKLKSISLLWVLFGFLPSPGQEVSSSKPVYKIVAELDVKVPMRDGVRLSTNVFRPDAPGKFPVLLMRTPYGNGGAGNTEASYGASIGYVVIIQDTRGRYESEGIFDAMQPEALDGYDTQRWIGEQPWCNGKIGTFGGSYVGFTQWMPAPLQSPYLVTMFPVVTFSDLHDEVYQNGAFRLDLFGLWSWEMTQPYLVNPDSLARKTEKILMSLPLVEQDKLLGWKIHFLRDWLSHPEHDRYWDRTSIGDGHSRIRASVYAIGGWYDILLKGAIDNYLKMTGPVQALVYASSSARNTDFTAKLVDVYPDGRAIRICEGIIRADHRDPSSGPTCIEPGKIFPYKIDLWATSNVFKKGHQIRVEISSSNFPRFDRNLNTGNYFATDTTILKAEQTIYHDREYPSCIILPVIKNP
jgi:predicted acyl esterase